jgi:hypothetical protein
VQPAFQKPYHPDEVIEAVKQLSGDRGAFAK